MKKILKNVLLFSALIGSVNCLALPAAAVDVATANTSVMADAADVVYSGTCGAEGDNITWTYNESESTMTFSGTGSMEKYYLYPWDKDGYNDPNVVPEWMNDSRISSYHAKHVVFEEGITEINKINNSFFGDVNSACDVTVPESATSFDATNVSIKLTLYGLDGSWFYGKFGIRENTSQEYVSIGTAKNPLYPASGTCTSGATWTFDYRTRELHISGSTMRTDEMPKLPCSKYIFEKDFIPPENKFYEKSDLNTFVMSMTIRSLGEGRKIYCYPNSPFAKEYEKIIATTDDDGSYADSFYCNYLPDDTGICGDVNLDGKVNLLDSVLLAKAVNGSVTVNDMQKKNMDCDGSGEIDIDDVTTLMQFLVHAVDSLPVK